LKGDLLEHNSGRFLEKFKFELVGVGSESSLVKRVVNTNDFQNLIRGNGFLDLLAFDGSLVRPNKSSDVLVEGA